MPLSRQSRRLLDIRRAAKSENGSGSEALKAHATFLRRVMARLVHAHIVVAQEGRAGGYRLTRPVESITLAEVYQAAKAAYQSEEIETHEIRNVRVLHMLDEVASEIEQSLLLILDRYTIASLMDDILPTSPRS